MAKKVHHVEVAVEDRTCARCGGEQSWIGEDVSRILAYMPAYFVEHECHLEKWACGTCKRGVTTAPGPDKVIERSAAGASLLAHVVVSKTADHTPLHRLHHERDVVFRYTPTGEGATGPWSYLAGRRGYIQADAAGVFDRLFNGAAASAIEVGCWAHARRFFIALQDTDCQVAYPIKLIGRMYRIERLADTKGLSAPERTELRRTRSGPVLDTLKRWLLTTTFKEPPKSDLAQAAAYVINHWTALTRFVEDGRLSLDNNLCERQIRDIALGRRNYLFSGSHAAAERSAAIYSLLRTAAQ